MSLTVKFFPDGGEIAACLSIPYPHGDHVVIAKHITCVTIARNYGKNYIRVLENNRKLNLGVK